MENIRGRLLDDYPDDDPDDLVPPSPDDRMAFERWLSERVVYDGQTLASLFPREVTGIPTAMHFAPPERNGAAPTSFADPHKLEARLVAKLFLHARGRPARSRTKAARPRRRFRDQRPKRR